MAHAAVAEEGGPAAFFRDAHAAFGRACEAAGGADERWFDLLGRPVRILCAGPALAGPMTAALAHQARPTADIPALTLCAWDTASTGVGIPPAGWPPTAYGAKGVIDGFNDDRFSTVYAPGVDVFHMFDRGSATGLFWLHDADELRYWETGFPFRTLLHWWTAGTRAQLVHSGGVSVGDDGVLITGVGGSGKSTTSLLCLEAGLGYAGDDYVAFELADEPVLHSLYSCAKVDPMSLSRFPRLAPLVSNPDLGEEDKALMFLHPDYAEQISSGFRIRAVLLPRVTGRRDTRVVPATPVHATRALAPTTVFQLPRFDREAFQLIVELAHRVPSFHLELGTDLAQIPPLVTDVIKSAYSG